MMKYVKYVGAGIGALAVGIMLMFGATKVVYPAISQLVGLAVAQTATLWNNVRDAAVGDGLSNGILAESLYLFNGTTFDRVRGTGGSMNVNVISAITPADGFANPTTFLGTFSLSGIFNGTTWDRWRGQVSNVQGPTILNAQTSSAVNTALTVTLTGVAGTRIHLYKMQALCVGGGTTTATVTDIAAVINSMSVPQNPMVSTETWPTGLTGTTAGNMLLLLNACGAGGTGVLTYEADRF